MTDQSHRGPGEWIASAVKAFVDHSPENHLQDPEKEPAFDTPLVGYAAGDEPLFKAYREHVGPFHWTPLDIFTATFPKMHVNASDLTVIAWILPQTRATRTDNRKERTYPAERWARARTFGEMFNEKLRRHVAGLLNDKGIAAVAPVLSPQWEKRTSERFGYASTWSERHAAYACGLGTFGLSDGLITPMGKAVRVGSVVAKIQVPPTLRPPGDHHAYCLFFTKGQCGRCMDRCPAGAITPSGHDKVSCKAYIRQKTMPYIREQYGFEGKGCGLCQTKVPCESKIPDPRF